MVQRALDHLKYPVLSYKENPAFLGWAEVQLPLATGDLALSISGPVLLLRPKELKHIKDHSEGCTLHL